MEAKQRVNKWERWGRTRCRTHSADCEGPPLYCTQSTALTRVEECHVRCISANERQRVEYDLEGHPSSEMIHNALLSVVNISSFQVSAPLLCVINADNSPQGIGAIGRAGSKSKSPVADSSMLERRKYRYRLPS